VGDSIKVMISSSVYHSEELLRLCHATLTSYGYDVMCSPAGTLPINPRKSNLQNCLAAVDACDIFVGFIQPLYGSGRDKATGKSVTHLELERAIERNKLRYMLVHSRVVVARQLLLPICFDGNGVRLKDNAFQPRRGFFDDLGSIEMYHLAMDAYSGKEWSERMNNWVQEYHEDREALKFLSTQFADPGLIRRYLEEE
jgi:hypothetical protein